MRDGRPALNGAVPAYGETDTATMYALLSAYTVLHFAQQLAAARTPGASGPDDPAVQKAARNLVLTEDFALVQHLVKYSKEILAGYDDEQLAALIAAKRVDDYKQALSLRNVLAMDSPATYGWILFQDNKNRDKLG